MVRVAALRNDFSSAGIERAVNDVLDAYAQDSADWYCDALTKNPRAVADRLDEYAARLESSQR